MSDHWGQFLEDVPWFRHGRRTRAAPRTPPGSWQPRSPDFAPLFPELTRLLLASSVTHVVADDRQYVLHSWEVPGGRVRSWLCPPPGAPVSARLYPAHRVLLDSFGGVLERANEPEESWLLNHQEVLTAGEAERDATFIAAYAWMFEGVPGGIPVDLAAHYSIAREANGNTTLCHRATGDILLFAPDHAFAHLTPLDGCPERTLYRIRGAANLVEWVAVVSRQWS